MAKRIVKWTLDGVVLNLHKYTETENKIELVQGFDLTNIFENFGGMDDVQKQCVVNGVKQKLSDSGASNIGDLDGKIASAKETWDNLLNGKWTGDRINSTGASENKKVAGMAKEMSKVVSLEGLMVKKALYPSTFTAEDAAKLAELIAYAAQYGANPTQE